MKQLFIHQNTVGVEYLESLRTPHVGLMAYRFEVIL